MVLKIILCVVFLLVLSPSKALAQQTPSNGPTGIVFNPNDPNVYNTYFTESQSNKIGKINNSGSLIEQAVPTFNSNPTGVAFNGSDPNGYNIWFTETQGNKIGKINGYGSIIEYNIPTPSSGPTGIVFNPGDENGYRIWFTETQANKIGKMKSDGTIVEYEIPTPNSNPTGIAFNPGDPNGYYIWFTETQANKIGKMKSDGTIVEYEIPTPNSNPTGIAFNSGEQNVHYIWFTETQGNKIGKINGYGSIIEYNIPTPNSNPTGIVFAAGGGWFTETQANKAGKITLDGSVIEYEIPTPNSGPTGIAFNPGDPNGYQIWFTETQGNKIGKIKTDCVPCDGVAYGTIVEYALPIPDYINPNVGSISVSTNPVIINSSLTASANFTDPEEFLDVPYSVEWDWGDGSVEAPYFVNAPGVLSRNHTYTSAGVYEIKLTVSDNVGETGTSALQYLSVYSPTPQGLFSAAQKYTSPTGAYPQDPSAAGNVLFGLSYKYQGDIFVGNRQFSMDFKNASFEFNATTILSLVISNGVGTIRGAGIITDRLGTYNFLVVGKEETNTIRVQIKDTIGNTIYDTQPGANDTAEPITSITAGNILAH